MRQPLNEKGHPASCTCGFCQNMRKLKKGGGKDSEKADDKDDGKKPTAESIVKRMLDT
jgi:hypothetical protein